MERCRNTYQEDGAQKETFETVTVRCSFYCTSADIGFCTSGYFCTPCHGWQSIIAAQQILPGGAKAILTLDNGETVYLDENADGRQLQLAGKQIQIDSTTLNYSAADGQVVQSALVYNKVEVPQGGEYTLVLNDGYKSTSEFNEQSTFFRLLSKLGSGKWNWREKLILK